MSLDEFLKTYFFPNGDRITWSTIRTHSRYDGYDNQVGFHSLMEPTIAEIILQEKHVNQTNPVSAKTSKQPAIQIIRKAASWSLWFCHTTCCTAGGALLEGGKGYAWVDCRL